MNQHLSAEKDELKTGSPLGTVIKIGLAFVITGVFVWWIYTSMDDPKAVWDYIRGAAILPLLAIIPVSLISHLLRAWRWRRFIGRPVSVFYAFSSVMIGYAVNDVLPRVGEIVRVVNMNRMARVPIARLATTLLAERLLDVLTLVILIGLSIVIEGERIAEQFPRLAQAGPLALIISLAGLAGLFAMALFADLLCRGFRKLAEKLRLPHVDKIEALIRQGAEGLAFLKKPSQAVPVLLETLGIWMLYWLAFILGLAAFGLLEGIGYGGGTVAFSVATAGVLVPAVGAIGPYHEFGKSALTQLYHVDPALALAFITVLHAMLFYVIGGVCGVITWGIQILVRKKRIPGEEKP